jgi:hypothetical protein
MQSFIDAWMRMTGRIHVLLCRIPAIGEPLARGLSWTMAIFPWLGGVRKTESIAETRQHLIQSGEQMGFPFEFSEIEGDHFTLELPYCPYGFENAGGPHHAEALRCRAYHRRDDSEGRDALPHDRPTGLSRTDLFGRDRIGRAVPSPVVHPEEEFAAWPVVTR